MIDQFRTVYRGGTGEIVEKKSRFIATVRLVESEEEALSCLEALRKKYWDARHNCFVYIIGENQETVRCSDDGEPSGTAGRPMLDVVQGAGLRNVLVVVTRYFGGTLLGTGGLVRAYSQAVQEGLANSVLIDEICGVRLLIETDYNGIGKIQYLLGQRGIPILESEYTDQVKIRVLVPKTEVDRLCAEITEGTNGKAKLEKEEELYFAQNDGELIFGDALTQYKNLEAEELGKRRMRHEVSGKSEKGRNDRLCGTIVWMHNRAIQVRVCKCTEKMERDGISAGSWAKLLCRARHRNQRGTGGVRKRADGILCQ